MCVTIGFLAPIFSKALGFVLFCRAFKSVPLFARTAVIAALVLFGSSVDSGTCDSRGLQLAQLLASFVQGLWAAVIVSGVFYAIELFASWFVSLVLPPAYCIRSRFPQALQGALFLVLLVVSMQPLGSPIAKIVVRLFSSDAIGSVSGIELVRVVGIDAMHLALLLSLPYLATAIILDLSLFVVNRFLRGTARSSLQLGIRFPILVMLLSLLLYPHSAAIAANVQSFFSYVTPVGAN